MGHTDRVGNAAGRDGAKDLVQLVFPPPAAVAITKNDADPEEARSEKTDLRFNFRAAPWKDVLELTVRRASSSRKAT